MSAATEPTSRDPATRRADALSTLASLLFITWCFVVGTLLLYAPWMPVWARIAASFSDPTLQQLLAHPTLRGAICGFGLFHLVYGTHDLDAVIARFLRRRQEKMGSATENDAVVEDAAAEEHGPGDLPGDGGDGVGHDSRAEPGAAETATTPRTGPEAVRRGEP